MAVVSIKYLEKLIGLKKRTLELYMCREEFKHIKLFQAGRTSCYENINACDLRNLKRLSNRSHNKWK